MRAYALEADQDPFGALRGLFAKAVDWLGEDESAGLAHGDLETQVATRFWDLARQAVQDHLDLRAEREEILAQVVGSDGVSRGRGETGRERALATIFGDVVVDRIAYRERGGTVALSVGVIEAGLGCEVVEPSSPLVAAEVRVRRVPVPGRGDRGGGALVSTVQPVLPRR